MVAAASAHSNGHTKGGGSGAGKSAKTSRLESGAQAPAAVLAGEDADERKFHDVEVFSLLNKKARGLRKKLSKIELAVQAIAEGKSIAKEQVDAIAKRDDTLALADEVEKWRDALAVHLEGEAERVEAAIAERLADERAKWEASTMEKVKQAERRAAEKVKTADKARSVEKKNLATKKGSSGDSNDLREIIALLYFSNLFSQIYPASMIERRSCLHSATFSATGGVASGPALLTNQDLSNIELMGKVVSMRSLHESGNHMEAIEKCTAAAGSFLAGESREVMPGLGATFEGLKARLAGILNSDYASVPPKPAGMMVMGPSGGTHMAPPGLRSTGDPPSVHPPAGSAQPMLDSGQPSMTSPAIAPPATQVIHDFQRDEHTPFVPESELILSDQRSVLVESTDPYEHVDGYGDEAADEVYYEYDESDFVEDLGADEGVPQFRSHAPSVPTAELSVPPPQVPARVPGRGGSRGGFAPRGRGEARGGYNARPDGFRPNSRGGGRGGAEGSRGRGRGRGRNPALQGDAAGQSKRAPAPKDEWQSVPAKKKS